MTHSIVGALREVRRKLSDGQGPMRVFALFAREDIPEKWDLLVSAPWGDDDPDSALRAVVQVLSEQLTAEERREIPRIVLLRRDEISDEWNGVLLQALSIFHITEGSEARISDCVLNGVGIRKAVLFEVNPEI